MILASTLAVTANVAAADTPFASAADQSGIAGVFAHHGYFFGFLVVLFGGLALNLTPCVYPLIGVTIAYFGNQSAAPRKVVTLAILYVLGIALMFYFMPKRTPEERRG